MRTRFLAIPRPARPAMLLAAGLLAVAMHALGGMGLMPAHRAGGGVSPEICRGNGGVSAGVAGTADGMPAPGGAGHDCCTLCVVSAPVLFTDAVPDFAPGPLGAVFPPAGGLARPATEPSVAHPPRGPPASG